MGPFWRVYTIGNIKNPLPRQVSSQPAAMPVRVARGRISHAMVVNGVSIGEIDGRPAAWSICSAVCQVGRDRRHRRCGHSCDQNSTDFREPVVPIAASAYAEPMVETY